MTPAPIYIAPRTPGSQPADTTEWTTVCHSREAFIWVQHMALRETSRWVSVERKRPYMVQVCRRGRHGLRTSEVSTHKTLDAALEAARHTARVAVEGDVPELSKLFFR